MRKVNVDRNFIVDLIVDAGKEFKILIEVNEIDRWVRDSEGALQEFFIFDQLTAKHVLYASEKIRQSMKENFFRGSFFQYCDSPQIFS